MPDDYLFKAETAKIKKLLGSGKLLDVGCGEGRATYTYSQIPGLIVQGIDYANNRLRVARRNYPRIKFITADLTKKLPAAKYDYIVSQRFLINLANWQQQSTVIKRLLKLLLPKGKLILCEGSLQGVKRLNVFRSKLALKYIPVRWHNVFIDDNKLIRLGFKCLGGFGGYFLLTHGVRPFFDQQTEWKCKFNQLAVNIEMPAEYSRLKIWQYEAQN